MMDAIIVYLSIGLILSTVSLVTVSWSYPYRHPPWLVHLLIIFMWFPTVLSILWDIGRRK